MRRLTLPIISMLFAAGCCVPLSQLVDRKLAVAAATGITYTPSASFRVTEEADVWHDASRGRDVPVRIYAPAGIVSRLPLVVFSHGIGEDRDSYAWLGHALAAAGYVAIHVTHAGTDKETLRHGYLHLYRATKRKENWIARPADVSFAITEALRRRSDIDPSRIAVAGHSAGAYTALALAGLRTTGDDSGPDRRVRVAVAMSMPRMGSVIAPDGYAAITTPVLHLTGTCDTSLIYRTFPRDRRVPFERSTKGYQLLVTIDGVTHNTFSNRSDARHGLIAGIVIAFLNGELRDDAGARSWIERGGLSALDGVVLERKP
jgi:predicted dienelactone hydrolase